MDRFKEWFSLAFGEFKGITTIVALVLLLIGALGFNWVTPNQRYTALENRVTSLETKQNEDSYKLDALIRIECLNNLANARMAGVRCEDYFGKSR